MKNGIKVLGGVLLAVIYCLAMVAVTRSIAYSDVTSQQNTLQEKIIAEFSSGLFCHISQSESSRSNITNIPIPNLKNSFTRVRLVVEMTEKLSESEFYQYIINSRKIHINQRNFDIIFPFHYFW